MWEDDLASEKPAGMIKHTTIYNSTISFSIEQSTDETKVFKMRDTIEKSANEVNISTIRSGKGDCIRIRFLGESGRFRNIIVDSGPMSSCSEFKRLYHDITMAGEMVDVLIITHYDEDHIGGILKLAETEHDLLIGELYFNAYKGDIPSSNLSATHNQRLFHLTLSSEIKIHTSVLKGDSIFVDGANLEVLSPDEKALQKALTEMMKEDKKIIALSGTSDWHIPMDRLMNASFPNADSSAANRASIVFIFEYKYKRMLFCGDSPAKNILDGLTAVKDKTFDLVKLPHHGSCRNISKKLLDTILADSFLICADGTANPSKQTIAKLLKRYDNITIYGNYPWWLHGFIIPDDKKYLNQGKLKFKNYTC